MTDWFRSWHGAPTDPKWRTIAKRAKVPTSLVVSVAWALMDRASQSQNRGSIDGLDTETLADFYDCDPDDVERIIAAMREKCVLTDRQFTSWEKRQPKKEDDGAAERKRLQRERDAQIQLQRKRDENPVAQCHTESRNVTLDTEKNREEVEKKEKKDICPNGVAVRTQYPSDFQNFWKGYPTDPNMSKAEALKRWKRLSPDDRQTAIAALPAFRDYCQANSTYRPVHACKYLSDRRFDGFADAAKAVNPIQPIGEWVSFDTAEFRAWEAYRRQETGRGIPRDSQGGWRFTSRWPPGHEPQKMEAA